MKAEKAKRTFFLQLLLFRSINIYTYIQTNGIKSNTCTQIWFQSFHLNDTLFHMAATVLQVLLIHSYNIQDVPTSLWNGESSWTHGGNTT